MKPLDQRVPGWPDYLADLKARGIWDNKELREAAAAEWDRLKREEQALDEAPVVADLRAAGVDVNSAWDIVNRKESFPSAIPVLRKHLELEYPPKVREGIARAMSESAARPYWNDLVRLYKREGHGHVKDAIAVALCGAAGPEQFDELISLSLDPLNGSSRVVLIWALERRIPAEQAEPILATLAKDPATKLQAEASLKVVKAKIARKGK
jgi:hypothetical protein